jgi:hypothetical protein
MPFGNSLLDLLRGRPVGRGGERLGPRPRHRDPVDAVEPEAFRPLPERLGGARQQALDRIDATAALDRMVIEIGINAKRIGHGALDLGGNGLTMIIPSHCRRLTRAP